MKKTVALIAALLLTSFASAQTTESTPTFIKGEMNIQFSTRTRTDSSGKPLEGVVDKYTLNVNMSNSALFRGTIDSKPILSGMFGTTQNASLLYSIDFDVVNPKNPAQTRNVGKLYGQVPIDANNVYRFSDGSAKVSILGLGQAKGFDSKFSGLALGKPPAQSGGIFSRMKQEALNITKRVNGKAVSISVAKYDKMEFQQHVLAAGPVQIYPESNVNGALLYDYARGAWYFQNVNVVYSYEGHQYSDSLTGNIRWIESPNRRINGEGEYQFDIRVNEPPASESSIFSGPTDESAFFTTDNTIPSLTGTMKYKDTIANGTVTASAVTVDLTGNQLTKQQTMYLCKLLLLSTVVPLNAE